MNVVREKCECGKICKELLKDESSYYDGIKFPVFHCEECDIDFYRDENGKVIVIS